MKRVGLRISRYLLTNVGPYFVFSWLLLSVILFVQQASRYADIFFSVNIPKSLIFQLSFALLPSVIAFTCPMAILVGVVIGLSKMQGDSELTVIRAAGVGNWQITLPIAVLGVVLSLFAFWINVQGVPFASSVVRNVALRTALIKLESPVEPGVFNTEINGYTVLVREGDLEGGQWRKIFIQNDDAASAQTRLITANSGRIDSMVTAEGEVAELVLEDASVVTLPTSAGVGGKVAAENLGSIRVAIKTRRDDVIKKLTEAKETPEELGLNELARIASTAEGAERLDAQIQWQRRILLSISPLIFAFLGTGLVLRFNRGGRGFGIFLALVCLVAYYLITLFGEQLTRTGLIGNRVAGFLPVFLSAVAIFWLYSSSRIMRPGIADAVGRKLLRLFRSDDRRLSAENLYLDLTTGIRDFDIAANLVRFFVLTTAFLSVIYLIFTAFELWKFAGTIPNGVWLLVKYLFYLIPFLYLQLAPSALMIATLATFVIKSRNNEIVTWAAAGQSIYRLLVPCLVFMFAAGIFNWGVQETIAPVTNRIQDSLRAQIRSRGVLSTREGKAWVADGSRIYWFSTGSGTKVSNLTVFEFEPEGHRIKSVLRGAEANWNDGAIEIADGRRISVTSTGATELPLPSIRVPADDNPFLNVAAKPSHMTSRDTSRRLAMAQGESEIRALGVALQKKYSTPLIPFLVTLFTAPFALSLSRRGKVYTVGLAVALWLAFMAVSSGFEQAALGGSLPPVVAVWVPLLIFSSVGLYLISRVRT
ncbi:MAG TPA: LptF/LptG family permease [Pyrinomonadaceae bacterium]|nr:LptF/LptG family permease [Pyrinomonadaceae bacterium]